MNNNPTRDLTGYQIPRAGLVYDPYLRAFDASFFAILAGTPSTNANKIRLNASSIASYFQFLFGTFVFAVNIPAVPIAGDDRIIGLRNPATAKANAYFKIEDDVFSCSSFDDNGVEQETIVDWVVGWEAVETEYKIQWERDFVLFFVGDVLVTTHQTRVGKLQQSWYINNANADDMDIGYILNPETAKLI